MSQPITVDLPHSLGAAEARRRIDEGFAKLAAQIGPGVAQVNREWQGDRLNFAVGALGQQVTGQVMVFADRVRIDLVLPGLLGVLAQTIRGRVARQGQVLLEKK